MQESHTTRSSDWYRLAPRRSETDNAQHKGERLMGHRSRGLQPIDLPENHDGMDLSALPPMRDATLTEDQVHQLFSDIEAFGSDILLMQRSPGSRRAAASRASAAEQLRAARDKLLSGGVARVQIRYRWQDLNWIDTLERRESGVRLVRIAHVPAGTRR